MYNSTTAFKVNQPGASANVNNKDLADFASIILREIGASEHGESCWEK